jgi:regulator of nucleoside diphosphate kinase
MIDHAWSFFFLKFEVSMAIQIVGKPIARPSVVIAAGEHARLMRLAEKAMDGDSPVGEFLAEELSRAHIVPDDACDPCVVRMGSHVTYNDEATNKTRKVTLVYPQDANIDRNRISILTPIGAALIGLRPAQSIQWPNPAGGMSSLTVLDVNNADRTSVGQ